MRGEKENNSPSQLPANVIFFAGSLLIEGRLCLPTRKASTTWYPAAQTRL